MTQDERNMLTDLANKIAQTPPPPKDEEAEEFIRSKIGNRPDALYLMTQTVLIQNLALQHAQQQIQDLQQRAGSSQQLSSGGSFLGQGAPPPPRSSYAQPGQQPQYAAPPPQYASAQSLPNPSGTSGFLRGAAQTAAGVAAGGLAFEAISSLFSHHGYGGGSGFGDFGGGYGGGAGFTGAPAEEIVNNYYDQPGGGGGGSDDYRADDSGGNYDDASNVDDSSQFDDQSSGDDGGGFDNSGDNFS